MQLHNKYQMDSNMNTNMNYLNGDKRQLEASKMTKKNIIFDTYVHIFVMLMLVHFKFRKG